MRVLVTGVCGFVGTRLARHLLARGDSVSGTYLEEPPNEPGLEAFEVDILDRAAIARVVAQTRPSAIVHLAGLTHVGASWRRIADYFQVNVLGVENVLAAAGDCRVLVASSAEVYGQVPEEEQPIRESRPLAPLSPYAMTKAAAERLALARDAVIVRSFNLVGAGQAETFALPSFARQLALVRAGLHAPELEVGDLSARRDFLHVEDGVRGYTTLIDRGVAGTAYNLGSGTAVSIQQALEMLAGIAGVELSTRTDPELRRPVDLPLLSADCTRLSDLGWRPEHSLREALEELWQAAAESVPVPSGVAGA